MKTDTGVEIPSPEPKQPPTPVEVRRELGKRLLGGLLMGALGVAIPFLCLLAAFLIAQSRPHPPGATASVAAGFGSRVAAMSFWTGVGGLLAGCLIGLPSGTKDKNPRIGSRPVLCLALAVAGTVGITGHLILRNLDIYSAPGADLGIGGIALLIFGGMFGSFILTVWLSMQMERFSKTGS